MIVAVCVWSVCMICVWWLLCTAAYSTDHYTRTVQEPWPGWIYWLSYFPSTPERVQETQLRAQECCVRVSLLAPLSLVSLWDSSRISWVICWLSSAPFINLKSYPPGGLPPSQRFSICSALSRSSAPPPSVRPSMARCTCPLHGHGLEQARAAWIGLIELSSVILAHTHTFRQQRNNGLNGSTALWPLLDKLQ